MLDVDAVVSKMIIAGIDKVALIPTMCDVLPATPRGLLTLLRGIMSSPVHSLARKLNDAFYTPEGHLKLSGNIYEIYALPDNQTVADAIEAYPEKFLGWIFLNPNAMANPVEELEKWRQVAGFVGVKLHPHWHRWAIEDALPIAKRCEQLRIPILIHLGFGDYGRWQVLTDRCPKLRLIFAHAGMPHFGRMWDDVRRNPNLHIDLSSPYLSERLVRRAVAAVGPERALYGTDAPYGFPDAADTYDYLHIKGWVYRLDCRDAEVDRIMGDTVEELLSGHR